MTMDDMAEIAVLFNAVYGEEFPPARLHAWFLMLKELPSDQAKAAALQLCRISSYPPKPADIVRLVEGDPRDIERLLEEEAERGCAHLEATLCDWELRDYGPITNAIVRDMGGVDAVVAQMADDQWKFQRSRLRTFWKAYRRRPPTGEAARPPIPRSVLESMNVSASEWRSAAVPKEQWLAQLQPVDCCFELASIPGLPAAVQRPALPAGAAVPELSPELVPEPVGS